MFKHFKGGSFKVFSDADVKAVHEASVYLLEEVGIKMHNEQARQIFADSGAAVDHESRIVKIPRAMIEDAVDSTPSSLVLCGREEKYDILLEGANVHLGTGGTVLNTLDMETGKKRRTEVRDVAGFAKMTDALDNIAFFVINCYPNDVPAEEVDINRFYHALANTSKHVMGGIYTMEGLRAVIKMAEDIAGGAKKLRERPFVSFITLMMSPLLMEVTYTDFLIEVARRSLPIATPSEPLAGANSPVTLAGTIALNNAESLGGLILAQLVNRGNPTLYGSTSSIMDMRTGTYMAGSIESALINAGCAQMAQYYKIPIYGTGGMSDSKVVDAQAGYESANTAMVVALSGCNYIHDAFGLLEFCTTLSYEKMVVDNDSVGMALRAVKGVEVNKETLATDIIAEIGPGGHFLDQPHTVEHVRSEFYFPKLADRQQRTVWEEAGCKNTFTRAHEEARRILAEHQTPGFSEDLEKKLREKYPGIK
ncbi:MAG: trimethylamine methyltransferase family protein [Bacillota bacterium]|nr:trimethylamine methyltransferase family protein [Bacillota bacterium]